MHALFEFTWLVQLRQLQVHTHMHHWWITCIYAYAHAIHCVIHTRKLQQRMYACKYMYMYVHMVRVWEDVQVYVMHSSSAAAAASKSQMQSHLQTILTHKAQYVCLESTRLAEVQADNHADDPMLRAADFSAGL